MPWSPQDGGSHNTWTESSLAESADAVSTVNSREKLLGNPSTIWEVEAVAEAEEALRKARPLSKRTLMTRGKASCSTWRSACGNGGPRVGDEAFEVSTCRGSFGPRKRPSHKEMTSELLCG